MTDDGYKARILAVRQHYGLSQQAMAKRFGVSDSTWQGYERGQLPKPEVLQAFVGNGLSADWVLSGVGTMVRGNGQDSATPEALDTPLMQGSVQAVEELLIEHDLELAPDKKARLVIVLYELFKASGKIDRKQALAIIGVAAA